MPKVVFVSSDGKNRTEVEAEAGQSILEIAHDNDVDIEGTCEGQMACSTCHVIVDEAFYDRLPKPTVEEEDMLDLAAGLRRTSRLGCQVRVTDELDGLTVQLPKTTTNMLGL